MDDIAMNIRAVRDRMEKAAVACGRDVKGIALLPISKTFSVESIARAIAAGIHLFGENRVQEAESKILHFRDVSGLEWHLVGHLQSNKARRAAELFDVIHSIDSARLAVKLDQAAAGNGKMLSVLLQVDLGSEETKFGAPAGEIRDLVGMISGLKRLRLDGLMTIPPFFENPEEARPYFAALRKLSESLEAEQAGCLGRRHLSMGMSHDFEAAIMEGATIIRVGTAIFGTRQYA